MLAAHHGTSIHTCTQPAIICLSFADPNNKLCHQLTVLFLCTEEHKLRDLCSSQLPWASACYCNELTLPLCRSFHMWQSCWPKCTSSRLKQSALLASSPFSSVDTYLYMDIAFAQRFLFVLHYLPDAQSTMLCACSPPCCACSPPCCVCSPLFLTS